MANAIEKLMAAAEGLEAARLFLNGNPAYEASSTVEIRELPRGE